MRVFIKPALVEFTNKCPDARIHIPALVEFANNMLGSKGGTWTKFE